MLVLTACFVVGSGLGESSYQRPHATDPKFYWMTRGLRQLLSDWHTNLSEDVIELMEGMLKINPRTRLTVNEVLSQPWFDGPDEGPMAVEN
jgi:serine/threonine protein kinase